MSVLTYIVGSASIAVGALAASRYLLSLTRGLTRDAHLRKWVRIQPAIKPRARRRAWNGCCIGVSTVATGTFLVLSVGDPALGRPTLIALIALLVWNLAFSLTLLLHRRSASPADAPRAPVTDRIRRRGRLLEGRVPNPSMCEHAGAGMRRARDRTGWEQVTG